jgi:hypothetical protein
VNRSTGRRSVGWSADSSRWPPTGGCSPSTTSARAGLASREVERRADELEGDERYRRLESRRADLAAGIKTLQKRLSAEEVRSVLFDIAPPEHERTAEERKPPTSGKYRPDGCRTCGRDWNVTPDGSPAGYRRLGAFVWECTDCGTLQDRSDPTNQRVARRR